MFYFKTNGTVLGPNPVLKRPIWSISQGHDKLLKQDMLVIFDRETCPRLNSRECHLPMIFVSTGLAHKE